MKTAKFRIVNKERGQAIYKKGGRHYRQSIGNIDKSLKLLITTQGRAQKEVKSLNANYYGGWEIEEVKE